MLPANYCSHLASAMDYHSGTTPLFAEALEEYYTHEEDILDYPEISKTRLVLEELASDFLSLTVTLILSAVMVGIGYLIVGGGTLLMVRAFMG